MKENLRAMFPILGLVGLMLVVFWPVLTGGAFLNTGVIYSDMWLFNYPLKDLYREFLVEGRLPFWTNLVGNGYPVFAEGQVGALYPVHLILFRFFPTLLAFNLNIFLHFVLAAVFTFAFCRISLKLSNQASFLAGMVYSLSGFFITHIHQINILMVVSYFPLVLLLLERLVSTKRAVWAFVLALVVALQILAGHIEMFYYSSVLGFGFFIFVAFFFAEGTSSRKGKSYLPLILFGVAFVLGVGICVAQILPTAELTKFSQRAEGLSLESASSTVWPLNTLQLFVNPRAWDLYRTEPGYHPLTSETVNIMALYGYIGIVPLLLACLAIAARRERFVILFTIFLIGAFAYGFGRSTQLFAILWEIVPGLKFFRYPVKIMFFIEFCLAILAGFGMDWVSDKILDKKVSPKAVLAVSMVFLGVVFADLYANNLVRSREIVPGKEWLEAPEVVKLLREKGLSRDYDYRVYTHGTNNLDYQQARKFEMQQQFKNILHVDFNVIHQIPMNREWFVLFLERQTKLNEERTSLDVEKGELGLSEEFKKSLALQSVRYLIADLPIEDPDLVLLDKVAFSQEVDHYAYLMGAGGPTTVTVPAKAVYVYEYKDAYPRALFVSSSRVADEGDDVLGMVMSKDFDPRKEVILEEDVEVEGLGEGSGKAEVIKDQEVEVEVSVEADSPGFLLVSDTYYPGWRAEIDGKPTEIYRVNYAFRAVPVKVGKHLVKFSYSPTNWRVGVWISGISLVIVIVGLGYTLVRRK
jgi:hypothetical protein